MLSVMNLLMGSDQMCISFEMGEGRSCDVVGGGGLGLVERSPFHTWERCPLTVSLLDDQHLEALEQVRPGQLAKLPALMAASQVDFAGKPVVVCR